MVVIFGAVKSFTIPKIAANNEGEGTRCPPLRFLVRFVMYLDYLLKLEQWIYLQFQLLTQTEVLHHATPLRGSLSHQPHQRRSIDSLFTASYKPINPSHNNFHRQLDSASLEELNPEQVLQDIQVLLGLEVLEPVNDNYRH
jgi:hypothetical protein